MKKAVLYWALSLLLMTIGKGVCELSSSIPVIYSMDCSIFIFFCEHNPEILFTHTKNLGQIIYGFHIAPAGSEDISTSRPSILLHNLLSSIERTRPSLTSAHHRIVAFPLDGPSQGTANG